ncbi:MAG: hypothetical protein HYT76_04810 [Deltaproteobacteria bacterium]|nr:hypothetical protein [Deltaproteobacteria bacterium]
MASTPGIHPLVLGSFTAAPAAPPPPKTKEQLEREKTQAEIDKLNAEAEKARVEAANAKKSEPKEDPLPQCNFREGKWCHVARFGATWRVVHSSAGNGTFETTDDPHGSPNPQYTYDPKSNGLFGALGFYGEWHNRWFRITPNGPYFLAGVAVGWDQTKWDLDKGDLPEALRELVQDSPVKQEDWSLGVPIGVEVPIRNDAITGVSFFVTPRYVRTTYMADAQGVGQTGGAYITGLEINEDEDGRTLAPTVHRFPGLSTNSFGLDFEGRVHLSRWIDVVFGYGFRWTGDIDSEIGDEERLVARGIPRSEIPPNRQNQPISVATPNEQFIWGGFGWRFEALGGK